MPTPHAPSLRRPLPIAALALALVAIFAAPQAAAAAQLSWKKSVVTFRDASPYGGSVNQAVSWINEMPGEVRLRRAAKGERADITIRTVTRQANWGGVAEVAYRGSRIGIAEVTLNRFWYASSSQNPSRFTPQERAYVTTHELLHALGVPHLDGCSMMRTSGFLGSSCNGRAAPPPGTERCGPQRKDAVALINRYGGDVGDFDGFFCEAEASV